MSVAALLLLLLLGGGLAWVAAKLYGAGAAATQAKADVAAAQKGASDAKLVANFEQGVAERGAVENRERERLASRADTPGLLAFDVERMLNGPGPGGASAPPSSPGPSNGSRPPGDRS